MAKVYSAKRVGATLRNWPVMVVGFTLIAALETYSALGIVQVVVFPLSAIQVALSFGCGVMAFLGNMHASGLKSDPRPEQQKRAFKARILALLLLTVPVYFLTDAFSFQQQIARYEEYHGSAAEAADRLLANDPTADSRARGDAAEALKQGIRPQSVRKDEVWFGSLVGALFLYGTISVASGVFWRPRNETEAEARRREAKVRAEKARIAREKKRKVQAKEKSGDKVVKLFG